MAVIRWMLVGLCLGVGLVLRAGLLVVTVDGDSMHPTLRHGDRVLVLRKRFGGRLRRQAIVVATSPVEKRLIVKRLTALAGDANPRSGDPIPAGHVFIVGDGVNSRDSRSFGPIPTDSIVGVVLRQMSG